MQYELMLILKPEGSEAELKAKIEKIKELITSGKGEVLKEEMWGKRVLAYPIKHFSEGFYYFLNFKAAPAKVKDLEKKLNLDDGVLRFLVTKRD